MLLHRFLACWSSDRTLLWTIAYLYPSAHSPPDHRPSPTHYTSKLVTSETWPTRSIYSNDDQNNDNSKRGPVRHDSNCGKPRDYGQLICNGLRWFASPTSFQPLTNVIVPAIVNRRIVGRYLQRMLTVVIVDTIQTVHNTRTGLRRLASSA
jgi:hypothetical protein